MDNPGILSVVATPIGNLKDITLRALEVLRTADLVLCEDTRVTKKLLMAHGISVPTKSYHAHSTDREEKNIIDMLKGGKNIALVSDAGTPGISDPGEMLVRKIRHDAPDVSIVAIPGPSAVSAVLSIAGVPTNPFTFFGFLPHKKGREKVLKEICASDHTSVFYESPHRIMKALSFLAENCPPEKTITIGRELTKVFEEIVQGNALEVKETFEQNPDRIRGEFVVVVSL